MEEALRGLIAKKVKLIQQKKLSDQHKGKCITKTFRPGVMT